MHPNLEHDPQQQQSQSNAAQLFYLEQEQEVQKNQK